MDDNPPVRIVARVPRAFRHELRKLASSMDAEVQEIIVDALCAKFPELDDARV